tara:strand:+ start:6353 stop:7753 length:1401 start_codon:yes stop_codon:yes gene_type:complete
MNPDFDALLRYYSRRDIQESILELAKDREVAVRYGDHGYGKRPDILQYNTDILELARNGATSFHVSEERWFNPLDIQTGMPKSKMNELRSGWDCVLDIDSPYVEYSQITTHLIIETLKFYGIGSYGVKFSGRKGFHIIIPFEAFPEKVGGENVKDMFPEGPRKIAIFLRSMIKDKLARRILSESTVKEISQLTGKPIEDIQTKDGNFNPFSIVDIDTILISSRHLYRSIYSVNEKSWLASVPLDPSDVMKFKLKKAKLENVKTGEMFMKSPEPNEARHLVIQAFDQVDKTSNTYEKKSTIVYEGKDYIAREPKKARNFEDTDPNLVREEYYPHCIKKLLQGIEDDGRKRAIFVLINYFKSLNIPMKKIKEDILEWNKRNYEPLREGYIISQLNWHSRQKESFLPPNCNNDAYYKALGVKCSENNCSNIKNPVNFTLRKIREEKSRKKRRLKRSSTKTTKKRVQPSP